MKIKHLVINNEIQSIVWDPDNIKVFKLWSWYISDNDNIQILQEAVDYTLEWWMAIISSWSENFFPYYTWWTESTWIYRSLVNNHITGQSWTWFDYYVLSIELSNWIVTWAGISTSWWNQKVLCTNVNYSTPYTPQYNWSPATKKYVDDSVSAITVPTKVSDLTNDSNFQTGTQVSQAISAAVASAYKYKGSVANYASLPASGNTEGDVWNVADTWMNYAWTGSVWDALGSSVDLSNYIAKDNTTSFTPTGDYNPATKKYVDDKHSTISITLTSAWWSNNTQTISATWVTANNTVIISPAPSNINDYGLCSIYCSWQWNWTLTFTCNIVPESAIDVNVLILN